MLRKTPPALLLAYGLSIVLELVRVARAATVSGHDAMDFVTGPMWRMGIEAVQLAASGLALAGAVAMIGRLTGRRATGARIAMIGFALDLAMYGMWLAFELFVKRHHGDFPELGWKMMAAADTCVVVVIAIGLALSARQAWLVAIVVPLALVTHPMWFLDRVFDWLHLGIRAFEILQAGMNLVFDMTMLSVIVVACTDLPDAAEPARAPEGLHRIALALRMRVVAKVAVAFFGLVMAGAVVRGDLGVYRVVTFAGVAVQIGVLCILAWGMLDVARSGAADAPVWPFTCAGALALAVVGLTLNQVPILSDVFYRTDEMFGGSQSLQHALSIGSIAAEVVASASIVLALAAIVAFARRRGLDALRTLAGQRAGVYVTISVVSIATQYWATRGDELTPTTTIVALGAALAILVATWLAAGVCQAAAAALGTAPGLPTARLMR